MSKCTDPNCNNRNLTDDHVAMLRAAMSAILPKGTAYVLVTIENKETAIPDILTSVSDANSKLLLAYALKLWTDPEVEKQYNLDGQIVDSNPL